MKYKRVKAILKVEEEVELSDTCNDICKKILKTRYYDLSEYPEYEVLETAD